MGMNKVSINRTTTTQFGSTHNEVVMESSETSMDELEERCFKLLYLLDDSLVPIPELPKSDVSK